MNYFKKLRLVLTYGPELEGILRKQREDADDRERERTSYHLHLCKKHQQEERRSEYSTENCDYCKLLRENNILIEKENKN